MKFNFKDWRIGIALETSKCEFDYSYTKFYNLIINFPMLVWTISWQRSVKTDYEDWG